MTIRTWRPAWLAVALVGFWAVPVQAQTVLETISTFTPAPPYIAVQTTTATSGTPFSFNTTGTYMASGVTFDGLFEEINGTTTDFLRENQVFLMGPGGQTINMAPQLPNQAYAGPTMVTGQGFFAQPVAVTPGTWNAFYRNTFDDAPAAGMPDAQMNSLSISFRGPLTPPTPTADLGGVTGSEVNYPVPSATVTNPHAAGEIRFYKFSVVAPINDAAGTYLDIDTSGTGFTDGEIGLYTATGLLVANDDDDGNGNFSALSFGRTSLGLRTAIGTGAVPNGRDGSLAVGDYYLAVAQFNTTFDSGFTVTTTGTGTGDFTVNFRTNAVPEPTSMLLAGLGAAGFGWRKWRRRKA